MGKILLILLRIIILKIFFEERAKVTLTKVSQKLGILCTLTKVISISQGFFWAKTIFDIRKKRVENLEVVSEKVWSLYPALKWDGQEHIYLTMTT